MKTILLDSTKEVKTYLTQINHHLISEIIDCSNSILNNNKIDVKVKWNSLCFFIDNPLHVNSAKDYLSDIVVFNLRKKEEILLVFPNGKLIQHESVNFNSDFKDSRSTYLIKKGKYNPEMRMEIEEIIEKLIKKISV
jgi:hypothetical protein